MFLFWPVQIVWKHVLQNLTNFRRPDVFLPVLWNVPYVKWSRTALKKYLVNFTHFYEQLTLEQKINMPKFKRAQVFFIKFICICNMKLGQFFTYNIYFKLFVKLQSLRYLYNYIQIQIIYLRKTGWWLQKGVGTLFITIIWGVQI